jgi:4'-phosphopantetheinyl transferase EntD
VNIERVDYAARARDRLDSVLRKIGPDPAPPNSEHQRRAIAQQAFNMTRKAVEKSAAESVSDDRAVAKRALDAQSDKKSQKRKEESRQHTWPNQKQGTGIDIVV